MFVRWIVTLVIAAATYRLLAVAVILRGITPPAEAWIALAAVIGLLSTVLAVS